MSNFPDSEKRLAAALARIDSALDRGQDAQAPDAAGQDALRAEIADLRDQLGNAQAETLRLQSENAGLAALADPAKTADESGALTAELASLKATRAAEIAALDDIMAGLENLLADSGAQPGTGEKTSLGGNS